MPPIRHIFLDDGDVMNDNAVRGPQWQRLIGEFFVPRLGGTMEAWGAANAAVVNDVDGRYWEGVRQASTSFDHWRLYKIDWLRSMALEVGLNAPADDDECHAMAAAAMQYITPRVRAAYPGAAKAIRELARAYELYTASNEHSEMLRSYLKAMTVEHLFRGFYGADLVKAIKPERAYYERVFADAGVDPAECLVVDDKLRYLESARAVGARIVVVSPEAPLTGDVPTIQTLAELPALLASGRLDTMKV